MKLSASLLNTAWVAAQYRGYRQFQNALKRPQAEQESRLFHYLRANADTEIGRKHAFKSIASVAEFQERVPLSTYDDYGPAVDAIRAGQRNVLTAAKVRCLEPSSGSTRAAKLIPYTADLQTEFGRALAPWIVDLARSTPAILGGPAYWSITPAMSETPGQTAAQGTAIGFESDSAYLGGWLQWLTSRTLVACDDLKHAADLTQFQRHTLVRLLAERELRLISVWHPDVSDAAARCARCVMGCLGQRCGARASVIRPRSRHATQSIACARTGAGGSAASVHHLAAPRRHQCVG